MMRGRGEKSGTKDLANLPEDTKVGGCGGKGGGRGGGVSGGLGASGV